MHIGVFAGIVSPGTLIMTQSFTPSSVIVFSVPSGWPRTFVVAAENSQGLVEYSGVSLPVNIEEGKSTQVGVTIGRINLTLGVDSRDRLVLVWNSILGADMYTVIYSSDGGVTYNPVYNGSGLRMSRIGTGIYKVHANFTYFNLFTDWSNEYQL